MIVILSMLMGIETATCARSYPLDVAQDVLLDDTTYHLRSNVESAFFALTSDFAKGCAKESVLINYEKS